MSVVLLLEWRVEETLSLLSSPRVKTVRTIVPLCKVRHSSRGVRQNEGSGGRRFYYLKEIQ